MSMLQTANGDIWYDIIDLNPPWVESPETVLFHHGVGIDHRIWCKWWPVLSRRFRLVRFDVRGYGRSASAGVGYDWSIPGLAADTLAVAKAAGTEQFHYVGESMGGALGYYLAIHHGEALLSLTSCTAPHKGGAVSGLLAWRQQIETDGIVAWSKTMMGRRFFPGGISEREWNWFHAVQSACNPDVVLGQGDMLAEVDLSDELGRIDTPTLMIAGDSSPFLSPLTLADTHSLVPDAELMLFSGARHGVVLSHGTAAAQAVLDFLDAR